MSRRVCSECGTEISNKRLAAVPETDLCIGCAAKSDVRIGADHRLVQNALLVRAEGDHATRSLAIEPHECLKLKG